MSDWLTFIVSSIEGDGDDDGQRVMAIDRVLFLICTRTIHIFISHIFNISLGMGCLFKLGTYRGLRHSDLFFTFCADSPVIHPAFED